MSQNNVPLTSAEDTLKERPYGLAEETRLAALTAVAADDAAALSALLTPMHPADIADLLEQIGAADRVALMRLWGAEIDGEVISELDENLRADLIEELPNAVIAGAVRDLASDDVVDLSLIHI